MKNFTKNLGVFIALASAVSANAGENAGEWKEIFKEDFGGNDENASAILKTPSNVFESDLMFYDWESNYEAGHYMIIKATQLAEVGRGYNLTNWGEALPGAPTWATGGDHTNQEDPNKGYYMAFDCPAKQNVKLYAQTLPVSKSNVEYKFEAYVAVMDKNAAPNIVCLTIEADGKTLASDTISSIKNKDYADMTGAIKWFPISATVKVDDPTITTLKFSINALDCASAGYDIALDDITISESKGQASGIKSITSNSNDDIVDVYTLTGILVKKNVNRSEATIDLKKGLYIIGNKKVLVK